VVDIGAGTGVLTSALVSAGGRVVALELDPALAADLRRRFGRRGVEVVEADARDWRWPREPFSVVSNLPFTGSGAILRSLLDDPSSSLQRADVVVQWEPAARMSAVWPATMRSTYWRAWYEIAIVARLSRSAFSPPPSVDAAVLRTTRRARALVEPDEHRRYRTFLEEGFGSRERLTRALRHRLTSRQIKRLAAVLGFDPRARARDLDARQWARLYAAAQSSTRGGG
jgi:23S rRNA (adenine-N6)-dimethyltransferase